MIADRMVTLMAGSSVIRALFEEGKNLAAKYGADNVFDFSLGNPNLPPPPAFKQAIKDILDEKPETYVHGYMSNPGYDEVRQTVADYLNQRFSTHYGKQNLIMTVGAASALCIAVKTLVNPKEEVLTFAPFFGEYRSYVANFEGVLKAVPANPPTFQPDIAAFEAMVSPKTRLVLVNTPNNPTGVVYSADSLRQIAAVLEKKQKEYGTDIYLLSDEPYRELVYDAETVVPWLPDYYENTLVGYSWSKSLSVPGERIGFLLIPDEVTDSAEVIEAAIVADRTLGYVNAPSLMQLAAARCIREKTDIGFYKKNRDMLYGALTEMGYDCIKPEGAFYLWVKSPFDNDKEFVELAKKHHLVLVPGSGFGGPGYLRMAYCVSADTIERSLPWFRSLMEEASGKNR